MQVTTTRHAGGKPFAWSYSQLKNFETCPKRHWHVDKKKDFREDESEALKEGNRVHDLFHKRIGQNVPFPDAYKPSLEPWVDRVFNYKGVDVRTKGPLILVEQKLAIDREFGPQPFFGNAVWFRGIADLLWILGPVAVNVDWKTGKIVEDSVQLMLSSACVFAHYPQVQAIRSQFIWLAENAETRLDISRADMPKMWSNLWSRIEALEKAHQEVSYPPTPSGICKRYCPVTICPYHGKGDR